MRTTRIQFLGLGATRQRTCLGAGENWDGNPLGGVDLCFDKADRELEVIEVSHLNISRYAPFASLSPRVSFFDSIVPGPAPGTYDSLTLPLKKADKAPYFGRSKATRFDAKAVDTPGPGSYVLPSSLHLKKSGKNKAASGLISTIQEHPLTRQPIQIAASRSLNVLPEGGSAPDLRQQHSSHGPVVIASPLAAPSDSSSYPPVESVTLNAQSDPKLLGPTAERLKYSNRRMPGVSSAPSDSHSSSHPPKSKAKIIWKRKHLPPSIPMGNFSFGYSENSGTTFASVLLAQQCS